MGFFSWLFGKMSKKRISGPGIYSINAVGESYYQNELKTICNGTSYEGHQEIVEAVLVLEDNNPHDNNAIRIDIKGTTVGYLSRQDAKVYREQFKKLGYSSSSILCPSMIIGGWDRNGNDYGHFGVKLDLPVNTEPLVENKDVLYFSLEKVHYTVLETCDVGEKVNLWIPKDKSNNIVHIYTRTGGPEPHKLGVVPLKYSALISSHLAQGLEHETEIIELSGNTCKFKCRLISKEEMKKREDIYKEEIRTDLIKKYTPKSSVMSYIEVNNTSKLKLGGYKKFCVNGFFVFS
jgi:hypothetical protein